MAFTGLTFLVFFLGFFVAELIRFQFYLIRDAHPFSVKLILFLVAWVSGVVLFTGLKRLFLFKGSLRLLVVTGGFFGVCWFGGIFTIEDFLSRNKLEDSFSMEQLGELNGHCGVHAGRVLSAMMSSTLELGKVNDRCRLNHWSAHVTENALCLVGEYACASEAMKAFGKNGYWTLLDRKYFYSFIFPVGVEVVSWDTLNHYFTIDQTLMSQRKDWYGLWGIHDQFDEKYSYLQQQDTLENLLFTRDLYEKVKMRSSKSSEEFSESMKNAKLQIEKIPQLQSDLETLGRKLNYNP